MNVADPRRTSKRRLRKVYCPRSVVTMPSSASACLRLSTCSVRSPSLKISMLASCERTHVSRFTAIATSMRMFASSGDWPGNSVRPSTTAVSTTLNSAGSPGPITFLLSDSGM
jgi:hypothetical protein